MEKRYQVFVSSTFADLQEERQQVIQALMEMDCIPAGMELFPATDEEQWEFIKKIIDDCDYYLLIIGGRYGTVSAEGISYTEMEYDYAVTKGIKVIALLHDEPQELPASKVEMNTEAQEKLEAFRSKVATGRLVKFWSRADLLAGLVALSLSKTIKTYPAVGWVRADQADSTDLLRELNDLRKENETLRKKAVDLPHQSIVAIESLSQGEDPILIKGQSSPGSGYNFKAWEIETSWNELFSIIGPDLFQYQTEYEVQKIISGRLGEKSGIGDYLPRLDDSSKKQIKIQLLALGLVKVDELTLKGGGFGQFWKITNFGKTTLMGIMSIKKGT
jgi:hypothetical protein